jgi:hypothetical protein
MRESAKRSGLALPTFNLLMTIGALSAGPGTWFSVIWLSLIVIFSIELFHLIGEMEIKKGDAFFKLNGKYFAASHFSIIFYLVDTNHTALLIIYAAIAFLSNDAFRVQRGLKALF